MAMLPKPMRTVITGAAVIVGGMFTLKVASSLAIKTLQSVSESKRKKIAPPCGVCRGQGFYSCKMCKGNSTIHDWSPLYDPVLINPCLCPTCEGHRVQRCLNCLGRGYS